jgi:hypothetical protein
VSTPLRTFDLRLAVRLDQPGHALAEFLDGVRTLAETHDGIEPLWITERRGRPRVHPPTRDLGSEETRSS